MDTNTEFNLQTFLMDMDRKQEASHHEIAAKLDRVIDTVNAHETRLTVVEREHKTIKWFAMSAVIAAFTAIADAVRRHFGAA